ncbi:hypothetical protein cyc_07839 [Cyclospora cayetanensis]|uniref:Uncharacterized protein n=1 Tax=Cyclospora cayetanensis TaxID=88456 RepID=A0A1D3D618_9EIME|nr:hypothetical protein cyc_07839 [Cyclospora cayetanensis]
MMCLWLQDTTICNVDCFPIALVAPFVCFAKKNQANACCAQEDTSIKDPLNNVLVTEELRPLQVLKGLQGNEEESARGKSHT